MALRFKVPLLSIVDVFKDFADKGTKPCLVAVDFGDCLH
jgi:hypothetical protein